ncbi:hypothetical protein AB6D20_004700 [Vibrio splendidus]|uniref:Uncharacterized protein n=1 Tax=Vibrio splendidus TaxID=29497 RepID=A0A2T5ETS6_VIBSP|nr:hypothetical protein [Vibrio splendidus]OEF76053.1 hypothetical protein A148_16070 [Vibrio splendidus 1F-157]PMI06396.1 hypothetical protein BCU63_32315 [Vibrio splendidus]PMJ61510.1 hypothetical protein BCU23_20800 [Vibrio splendidus]PTP32433.1 hypothetical protein CWO07_14735 [Vibrio splendidus]PTP71736.1 hypothetical protein CWO23_08585 [Vibrio splendidus]
MRIVFYVVTLFFASLSFGGFEPIHDKVLEKKALDALEGHLVAEGLTKDDAEIALAYEEGGTRVFFFLVREHQGEEELYRVFCSKVKCRFRYN